MKRTALSLLLIATVAGSAPAQSVPAATAVAPKPSMPFVAADAKAAVLALATALDENFVFPATGKDYAAMLRAKLASGGYASFASADEFAKAVTDDLQAVHKDGHLRLFAPQPGAAGEPPRQRSMPAGGIEKAGWIADNVAYIQFSLFPGDEKSLAALRTFLAEHAEAKTLIIDARGHRGGGLGEMDLLFPQIYAEPATLVHMDTRVAVEREQGSPFEDSATVQRVDGPEGVIRRAHMVVPAGNGALSRARIFLLTSARSASAAEHLSLSLKRTGRATLLGETTGGAGHYGGMVPMGAGYAAFIPVGRTFDPDTGSGWEGTGVAPDIAVPADRALVEALTRSGVAPDRAEALSAEYSPPLASMTRRAR